MTDLPSSPSRAPRETGPTLTPAQALEAIDAALKHLGWMCDEKWAGRPGCRWSIPAKEGYDSDCILADGLRAGEQFVRAAPTKGESE